MRQLLTLVFIGTLCSTVQAQRGYPPKIPGATVETYRKIGDVELKVWIQVPANHKPEDKRAAVVFFFGGGWRSGSPTQFAPHCKYLAERGMVAMTADYRVSSRHNTKAIDCVADTKTMVRWIRQNAARLGVDPNRIAAGGGSAGGHLAACTGVIPGLDDPQDDLKTSSIPNAMILFNPALVLAPIDEQAPFDEERMKQMEARVGGPPQSVSPFHHVAKGNPPAIIFHGKADTTVPYWTAEVFTEAMTKAGNSCQLCGFADAKHGFFNYRPQANSAFLKTTEQMDAFLVSRGFLKEK